MENRIGMKKRMSQEGLLAKVDAQILPKQIAIVAGGQEDGRSTWDCRV